MGLVQRAAFADFNEPVQLTSGTGQATQAVLAFDVADNAYIVSVVDEQIQVDLVGPNLRATVDIPGAGTGQGEPSIATGSVGEAHIAFSQLDTSAGGIGRDIYLTHNSGGAFVDPIKVSNSRLDEFAPTLVLGIDGFSHVAWARSLGESETTMVVYRDHQADTTVDVAVGGYPSLWVDTTGGAHLLYTRANDLYYINNSSGEFENEIQVVSTPTEPEYSARLGGTIAGALVIGYSSLGSLYMVSKQPGGDFSPPSLVDPGGVLDPELQVRPSGALSVVYSKDGDVRFVQGLAGVLLDPVPVVDGTEEVESNPTHRVDPCGITHVAFLRDGDVFYTNNAGDITAEFSVESTTGEVPLTVHFLDLSAGKIQAWLWEFGDGAQATTASPSHTYDAPGTYTVRLSVFTADRESTIEREDYIVVQEPFNTMEISDQRVAQGQEGVYFPVIAGHREDVMAFQVHAVFDSNILAMTECTRRGSVIGQLIPEIWECNVFDRSVELGCIIDFVPPFDGRILLAGENQILVNLIFNVSPTAPAGTVTEIELINNREVSQIFNIFTVDNTSKLPVLESSTVTVVEMTAAEGFFVRGDVDGSGSVDITDGISLLNFLFTGSAAPVCYDAADVGDSGSVDISGAIYILNFLFTGGPAPHVPYPNAGLDANLDDPWTCL
jgi:PKD repeat protein